MSEIPDTIADVVGGLAVTSVQQLIPNLPAAVQDAASNFLAEYASVFFELSVKEIWEYIRRMNAGDFEVIPEIIGQLSDDAFLSKVEENTAVWAGVAATAEAQKQFTTQLVLKLIPIVGAILAALVGL